MIHVFHGFLGSPEDFHFLRSKEEMIFHDLYLEDPSTIEVRSSDTLIGYSLGGRVAMDIAHRLNYNLKHLVVMNSHPGIAQKEQKERSLWEEAVLEKLRSTSKEDFLQYWNTLPLFSHDEPLRELSLERYRKSETIFNKYRLSQQRCHLPELELFKDKVLWIAGALDDKYATLARELIVPSGIPCVFINAGHRLHQHPEAVVEVLKARKIL